MERSQALDTSPLTPTFDWMAPRYERQTATVSWGRYRRWMARTAAVAAALNPTVLVDAGAGTGVLLRELARRLPQCRLVAVEPSSGMAEMAGHAPGDWHRTTLEAYALAHPAECEVLTTTFVLRDLADPVGYLRAAARVLRPGGHLVLLETHTPTGWRGIGFRAYFHGLLPLLGRLWLTRDWPFPNRIPPYRWLSESHRRWNPSDLPEWLRRAGFAPPEAHSRPTEVILLLAARKAPTA
ncbi:MAG: class I SAM-dependent methyltransferase [Firmicutes bacterium]|nr:class I SAM-dependent methyltransferase [Alicyclobacillaceae bacterium]MCL6496253.1 class I SAM-dependent methyltransferase [Bacillota bacterium]